MVSILTTESVSPFASGDKPSVSNFVRWCKVTYAGVSQGPVTPTRPLGFGAVSNMALPGYQYLVAPYYLLHTRISPPAQISTLAKLCCCISLERDGLCFLFRWIGWKANDRGERILYHLHTVYIHRRTCTTICMSERGSCRFCTTVAASMMTRMYYRWDNKLLRGQISWRMGERHKMETNLDV